MPGPELTAIAAARATLKRLCEEPDDKSWLQATQWFVAEQEAEDLRNFAPHDFIGWLRETDHIAVAERDVDTLLDNVFEGLSDDDDDLLDTLEDINIRIAATRSAMAEG